MHEGAKRAEDRRKYRRVKAQVTAQILLPDQISPIRTKTSDLSAGGCYIEMMFTLPVGTKFQLTLWVEETKLEMQACVATCDPQFGNGIIFIDPSPATIECLQSYIAKVE